MDEDERNVTFLYKLTPGICEKSFGMNVAMMAGIPTAIIERAASVAKEAEISHKLKDTTYAMQVDGEDKINVTPAIVADIKYLFLSKKKDPLATERILKSFKNLNI
jgi:DNA mismatch repair protein MSH6